MENQKSLDREGLKHTLHKTKTAWDSDIGKATEELKTNLESQLNEKEQSLHQEIESAKTEATNSIEDAKQGFKTDLESQLNEKERSLHQEIESAKTEAMNSIQTTKQELETSFSTAIQSTKQELEQEFSSNSVSCKRIIFTSDQWDNEEYRVTKETHGLELVDTDPLCIVRNLVDSVYSRSTWNVLGTDTSVDPETKDIILRSESPYDGDVFIIA